MDENTIQPQQNSALDATPGEESDAEVHSDRIFDISSDLDISPVTDPNAFANPLPTSHEPPLQVNTPLADAVSGLGINQLRQPARKIPAQGLPVVSPTPASPKITPVTIANKSSVPPLPYNNPHIKAIRTYESDVAELLAQAKTSSASIAIAANRKETGSVKITSNTAPPSQIGRNILLTLISLMLIGGGAYGAYYLYLKSAIAPSAPVVSTSPQSMSPGLFPVDFTTILPIDGLSATAVIAKVQSEESKPQTTNSVREIIPVVMNNGNETRVTGTAMFKRMSISAPSLLSRSLEDPWMLGVYANANGQKSIFVISTNNFFQNSFAGMLQWESTMPDDLKLYLGSPMSTLLSGTTSSSTTPFTLRGNYINSIIQNKDVREYQSADGHILFLYSFVDSKTMVIATDEAALSEIVSRLEKQSLVR